MFYRNLEFIYLFDKSLFSTLNLNFSIGKNKNFHTYLNEIYLILNIYYLIEDIYYTIE